MNPPPNPHEAEARASRSEYIRPMLVNPPADDAALLARAAATWPGMGRYLADARIGIGLAFDRESGMMVQRMTVVVEIKGDYQK